MAQTIPFVWRLDRIKEHAPIFDVQIPVEREKEDSDDEYGDVSENIHSAASIRLMRGDYCRSSTLREADGAVRGMAQIGALLAIFAS
jgi:hypothetical protein